MKNISQILNVAEDVLIVGGVAISLPQLETIFGIVLLSIQIILILVKGAIKIYNHVKNKKLEDAIKDVEDTQKEIEDLTNKKGGK